MSKFDVYIPVPDADYHEYFTSVYAESEEEAYDLAMKALAQQEIQEAFTDANYSF